MSPRGRSSRFRLGAFTLLSVPLLLAGCDEPTGPSIGTILVTVTTTGQELDADGFTVRVGTRTGAIEPDGELRLTDVTAGTHTIELEGLAGNCVVDGGAQRTVTVTADRETAVEFAVSCSATVGVVEVTITTTGVDEDPDGYVLTAPDQAPQAAPVNGTATLTGVAPGTVTITVGGVAPNCTAPASVSAEVVAGATAAISLAVACTPVFENTIVFVSHWTGSPSIWLTRPDGGGTRRLTNVPGAWSPAVSPDGRRIAFGCVPPSPLKFDLGTVCLMEANGAGLRVLSHAQGGDTDPAWSPDGTQLVFARLDGDEYRLWRSNLDGSGLTQLTFARSAIRPAWSPDGTRIAFTDIDARELCILTLTSGDFSCLEGVIRGGPAWSPDGSRIAYGREWPVGDGSQSFITIIDADGGNPRTVGSGGSVGSPAWSPDGTVLVYNRSTNFGPALWRVTADGDGDAALPIEMDGQTPHWHGSP